MLGSLLTKAIAALTGSYLLNAVSDCAPGESLFDIRSISIDPAIPVSGAPLTLHLQYEVPQGLTVTGGTAEYDVTYNYIPFTPSEEPLCQDVPCPLGPGLYTNHSTTTWPDGLSGQLVSRMKWWDSNKNLLLCVEIASQTRRLQDTAVALQVPQPVCWRPALRGTARSAANNTGHASTDL